MSNADQGMSLQQHIELAAARDKARVKKRLFYALLLLATVYVIAVEIYHYTEGWSWEDSIFFTTQTITTVGYGDMVPHSYWGRLITIPMMLVGISIGLYTIYAIQDYGRANLGGMASEVGNRLDGVEHGRHQMERRVRKHVKRHIKGMRRK
jgi:hypothetical protein